MAFKYYNEKEIVFQPLGKRTKDITGCQRHGWNNEDNFKKIQANDEYKNSWCKDNNILLIRIPYTHYNQLCINDLLPSTSNFKIN